jgi:lysophospholipase L1-like esterase
MKPPLSIGTTFIVVVLMLVAGACGFGGGQMPQQAGPQPTPPAISAHPQLDTYRGHRVGLLMNDFGELARYRAANAAIGAPTAGEQRVIFFGDSISDNWHLDRYFPGKGYINRGIGGQTTSQMLVRFRQDVIDLQPHVVVILAGTNDIAGNTGPISVDDIERNYATLAELARVHHIVTIFSSVTPVNGDVPAARELFDTRPPGEVLALNTWLKNYSAANGDIYLDYFSAMIDERGLMRPGISVDGLHPNDAGYKIMTPLAENAIKKALQR